MIPWTGLKIYLRGIIPSSPRLLHESLSTTHMYVEADRAMNERALSRLNQPEIKQARYRPPKPLLTLIISAVKQPKLTTGTVERKKFPTHRIVLNLGTEDELAVVRRIYELYLNQGMSEAAIANVLNDDGVSSTSNRPPYP